MQLKKTNKLNLPFTVCIIVSEKDNLPIIELRRATREKEIIKQIITAAFNDKPIIIQPIFTNRYKALASLIDKGIMYREGDSFYFTF